MEEKVETGVFIKEWARTNLVGNIYISPIGDIHVTMKGIKETINQPHQFKLAKNHAILNLPILLETSEYVGSAPDINGKVKEYHYLGITILTNKSYIVIKETWEGRKHFYSIVDKLKEK